MDSAFIAQPNYPSYLPPVSASEQGVPLESLVASIHQGMAVIDCRTESILAFNDCFCELWRLEASFKELRAGRFNCNDLLNHGLSLVEDPYLLLHCHHALKTGEIVSERRLEVAFRDGRVLSCLLRPLHSRQGDYIGHLYACEDITERKRSEETRREVERRFRDLLETVQQIAVLLDSEGNITFVNDYFLSLTGSLRSEVLRQNWFDRFVPAEEREQVRRSFTTHLAQGFIAPHDENQIVVRGGERRQIAWNNTLLHDLSGQVIGTASLGVDITDLRQMEAELRNRHQEESRLRRRLAALHEVTLDLALCPNLDELCRCAIVWGKERLGFDRISLWLYPDAHTIQGTYGIDEEGRLRDERASSVPLRPEMTAFQALHGHSAQVIRTQTTLADDKGNIIGEGWNGVVAIRDGGVNLGFLSADNHLLHRPYQEQDGELLSLYASALGHLYTSKRLEAEQREREELYRQAIDAADSVAYQTDHTTRSYRFIGEGIERLTGYPAEEFTFETWQLLEGRTTMRGVCEGLKVQEARRKWEAGEVKIWMGDYYVRHKNGDWRWISDTSVPLFDGQGRYVGSLGILQDITERKRLEEQFLQAQKMESLGRLAGGVAHDFNNLLTAILGYTELAEMEISPDSEAQVFLSNVRSASERAANLTSQLLAFARKQVVVPKQADLNALTLGVDQLLQRLIGEDIERVLMLEESLWSVKIDPGQFEQILLNLAVNARDAMPEGGSLIIRTANATLREEQAHDATPIPAGDYVLLSVEDSGCGIADHVLPHIFEPFYTTKEVGKGTGLGLATVHGIVRQSGGFLQVSSVPGAGSAFRVYLPRYTGILVSALGEENSGALDGDETILLVEDEMVVREIASRALRSRGYHVLEANDAREALKLARSYAEPIHLLLTDVVMPHMSGGALAQQAQKLRPEMKALFVSGYAEDEVLRRSLVDEAMAFLQKPYTPVQLVRKVRETLDSA